MMHTSFQYDHYLLKRQVLALTGIIRIYNPYGQMVLFSQQKMFKLKEDIRVYTDETLSQELLYIQARQIIDFSAAYDVVDSQVGTKVGVLRRKGFRSIVRDEWEVLDASDQPIGALYEDSLRQALLRRFLLGILLPQNYDLSISDMRVADLRQKFNLFRYELEMDFSMDTSHQLDHRLGIAAGILLGIIERHQERY
jgi:hypothetical protein